MKLQTKVSLVFILVGLLSSGAVVLGFLWHQHVQSIQSTSVVAPASESISQAKANLSALSDELVLANQLLNTAQLKTTVEKYLNTGLFRAITVYDAQKTVLFNEGFSNGLITPLAGLPPAREDIWTDKVVQVIDSDANFEVVQPVLNPLDSGLLAVVIADVSQITDADQLTSPGTGVWGEAKVATTVAFFLLGMILLAAWLVADRLLRPINGLIGFADRIGHGELGVELANERDDEFGRLGESINTIREKWSDSLDQVNQLAYIDQLTQLPNRAAFKQQLAQHIKQHSKEFKPFALLIIDLDNFKKINDTLGHTKGDDILTLAAQNMSYALNEYKQHIEQRGEPASCFLARLGSDEFAVLFSAEHCAEQALELAKSIQDNLNHQSGNNLVTLNHLYSSIGITLFPKDGSSENKLLKNANIALQVAKKSGYHECCHFSHTMQEALEHQYTLENELAKAITNEELMLFYQPQIDLKTEAIIGCEALIRWHHPALGMISPVEFLKIAEGTAMIGDITKFVIARACRDINQYFSGVSSEFNVSINLSGLDFIMHDVVDLIDASLVEHQIDPKQLAVELTETSMLNDEGAVLEQLTKLSEKGHDIWLDDFGTGFSCLHHLRAFPITGIKIDRSFIQHLDQSTSEDNQINRALITFAKALKLSVVTEGVETHFQHQLVQSFGANKSQGYYYGKAVQPSELFSYIKKHQKIA